jgi:hypothetical protein
MTEGNLAVIHASTPDQRGRLVLAASWTVRPDFGSLPELEEIRCGILTPLAVQLGRAMVRTPFDEVRLTKSRYRWLATVRLYLLVTAPCAVRFLSQDWKFVLRHVKYSEVLLRNTRVLARKVDPDHNCTCASGDCALGPWHDRSCYHASVGLEPEAPH